MGNLPWFIFMDRVKPLKIESTETGEENDEFPTPVDPNEDYIDTHGISFQSTTSNDEVVFIDRDAENNLTFKDSVAGSFKLLNFDIANYIFNNVGGFIFDNNENAVTKR